MRSFARLCAAALGVLAVVGAGARSAAASIAVVPEIDLSVIPAAVGVVTAGVLMLRARRGSKR